MKKFLVFCVAIILIFSYLYSSVIFSQDDNRMENTEYAGIPPIKLPPVPPTD